MTNCHGTVVETQGLGIALVVTRSDKKEESYLMFSGIYIAKGV